jgi:site-specific DNA-methyltransferase (adenine-specific)
MIGDRAYYLFAGDNRHLMANMGDNTVDAVVTDGPYELVSIRKRFGGPNAAPQQFGTDGAYARAARGFMGQTWDGTGIVNDPAFWAEVLRVLKPGGWLLSFGGTRTYHRMACAVEDAGFEIRDMLEWLYGSGFPKGSVVDGWGPALKPGHEPICMARKPFRGSIASCRAQWSTGALNIGACRVCEADAADEAEAKGKNQHGAFGSGAMTNQIYGRFDKPRDNYDAPGRFPANVIHDGLDDEWARFFYCAKASNRDRDEGCEALPTEAAGLRSENSGQHITRRDEGYEVAQRANVHPTVKPTDLMRWLCRLVTPASGIVFDPFAGSGSTGKAAMLEGFRFVGAEMTPEYIPIAQARIYHAWHIRAYGCPPPLTVAA